MGETWGFLSPRSRGGFLSPPPYADVDLFHPASKFDLAGVGSLRIVADKGVISERGAAPAAQPSGDFLSEHLGPIRERSSQLGGELSPRPPCDLPTHPPCGDVDLSRPASVSDKWMGNKGALRVDPPARGPDVPENGRCFVTGSTSCVLQTGAGDFRALALKKSRMHTGGATFF